MCVSDVTEDLGQFVAMKVGCWVVLGKKKGNTICVFRLGL